jgi:alanyl-tRNA synthetase
MTANELRKKYLDFFVSKGHKVIPSAPLVPENDPSVLFTTAGMHPLVPYLLGQPHPLGKRIVDIQKCIRTNDIDEVGDFNHHTFFEMLGNWSLGDYFKKESISWSYEFLTKHLNMDPKRIFITCFEGDSDAPRDDYSADVWQSLGIPKERIFFFNKKENWWGPAGETGPCGPDSEMHYDLTQKPCGPNCSPGSCDCGRFSEIWNNVFMEYNKDQNGKYTPLSQKNVDTGMGLERVLAILNNQTDDYETDLWFPVIKLLEKESNLKYKDNKQSFRIIADHLRSAVFAISDGVIPSNKERGYVLRRLIRRSMVQLKQLNISDSLKVAEEIAETFISIMSDPYQDLKKNKEGIKSVLSDEIQRFDKTLDRGLREFNKLSEIDGKIAFNLFQTYGFPLEITAELATKNNFSIDRDQFQKEFEKHQEISRNASAAAGKFKGGLADHSETTTKYHTATHLLHQALRDVLGDHVKQAGSNITEERLRFDFSHDKPLTDEQIKKVEGAINQKIQENLPVTSEIMAKDDALKLVTVAMFADRYPDQVTVYTIGNYSKEICGGPHVKNTSEIGKIEVGRQESVGAGVRRIYLKLANGDKKDIQRIR